MAGWIKCPRCDLNYMRQGEEYCDVCKAELKKAPPLVFAVDEDDENEGLELCPICHQNYIGLGEKMCAKCAEEMEYKESRANPEDDESWKEFLDDEEEESYDEPDDFDIPDINEEDFEEDDEDEEDEDEDDDFEDEE